MHSLGSIVGLLGGFLSVAIIAMVARKDGLLEMPERYRKLPACRAR